MSLSYWFLCPWWATTSLCFTTFIIDPWLKQTVSLEWFCNLIGAARFRALEVDSLTPPMLPGLISLPSGRQNGNRDWVRGYISDILRESKKWLSAEDSSSTKKSEGRYTQLEEALWLWLSYTWIGRLDFICAHWNSTDFGRISCCRWWGHYRRASHRWRHC